MFALTIPLIGVLVIIFICMWGSQQFLSGFIRFLDLKNILPVILVGVPLHELLHATGWIIFGNKTIADVRLGFQWKTLTPYAHLKVPISVFGYRMGTTLPGLSLGLLPYLIGTILGNGWVCVIGLFFLFAAGGDLLSLWIIRKLNNSDLVQDHPSRVGCLVIEDVKI